jgi:hypothetical protein
MVPFLISYFPLVRHCDVDHMTNVPDQALELLEEFLKQIPDVWSSAVEHQQQRYL